MTDFPGYYGDEGDEYPHPPVCPHCNTRDHYPCGPGGTPACLRDEPDDAQEWFDSLEDFEPVCEAHERFDCKRCAGRGVENAVEDL